MMVKRNELVEKLSACADWGEAQKVLREAGPAAHDGVIAGLEHDDPQVRKWCAGFLDHNATPKMIPAMIRALDDKSAEVRRHAVHAIGCQPCKPAPLPIDIVAQLIRKACDDPSVRVRRAAVHLLGLQPADPRTIPALERIVRLERDSKVISNAHFALARNSKKTIG